MLKETDAIWKKPDDMTRWKQERDARKAYEKAQARQLYGTLEGKMPEKPAEPGWKKHDYDQNQAFKRLEGRIMRGEIKKYKPEKFSEESDKDYYNALLQAVNEPKNSAINKGKTISDEELWNYVQDLLDEGDYI